jgi:hypothetical protein
MLRAFSALRLWLPELVWGGLSALRQKANTEILTLRARMTSEERIARPSAERRRLTTPASKLAGDPDSARLDIAGTEVPAYPIKAKAGLASFDYAQDRLSERVPFRFMGGAVRAGVNRM